MREERPTRRGNGDTSGVSIDLEMRVRRLAVRQHGVVARTQLLAIGFTSAAIGRRIRSGVLRPLYRGVYLVGPVAPPLAHEMAAVLACGERSFLSHRPAAHFLSLTPYLPEPKWPEVTVIGRDPRPPQITVHRVTSLRASETTTYKRIPITTPARTLLDLAPQLTSRELERSLAEAFRRRIVRPAQLRALLARHPGRPGTPALRHLLETDAAFTRSELEDRFLVLILQAGLPEPETNAPLGSFEIDFLWREQRLVVELDGWDFHSDRMAFENDRRRDADLVVRGYRVIRVTWRQLRDQPLAVAARLAAALAV